MGRHNVDDAIIHLAPLIGERLLDRAERAIKARLKGESRARARIALAGYGERDRLLDVDAPALVELGGADGEQAIATLAACGRGDAVVEAAIAAGSRRASDALAAAAPHLDETLVRRALPAAATAAGDGCHDGLTALLGRLASFGAAQAQEALGVAAATHNDELLRTATTTLRHAGENEFDALGLITNPQYLLAAAAGSGRAGRVTAADLSDTVAWFGNLHEQNRHAFEAFDVLHPLVDAADQADPRVVATLTALIRFQLHQHKDWIVVAAMRRMVRASGPEPVLDLASEILAKDRFDAAAVWAIAAIAAASDDPATFESLQGLAVWIRDPVRAAVADAALLRFLDDAEAERAWDALFAELTPDVVEIHSSWAALLVDALPRPLSGANRPAAGARRTARGSVHIPLGRPLGRGRRRSRSGARPRSGTSSRGAGGEARSARRRMRGPARRPRRRRRRGRPTGRVCATTTLPRRSHCVSKAPPQPTSRV